MLLGKSPRQVGRSEIDTFLDLIDYLEPTMVIVGSRGLGKLQGYASFTDVDARS